MHIYGPNDDDGDDDEGGGGEREWWIVSKSGTQRAEVSKATQETLYLENHYIRVMMKQSSVHLQPHTYIPTYLPTCIWKKLVINLMFVFHNVIKIFDTLLHVSPRFPLALLYSMMTIMMPTTCRSINQSTYLSICTSERKQREVGPLHYSTLPA